MISKGNNRQVKELFDEALEYLVGSEEDNYGCVIQELHRASSEKVYEIAKDMCGSAELKKRVLGIDVLAQLGVPELPFAEETKEVLARLLECEEEKEVLVSACTAFGHLGSEKYIDKLLPLIDHSEPEVREAVVFGVMKNDTDEVTDALTNCLDDESSEVRNWATFAFVEYNNSNRPRVTGALRRRLGDGIQEVRGEALVALAQRKDEEGFRRLKDELKSNDVSVLALEAAGIWESGELLPLLREISEKGEPKVEEIDMAYDACAAGRVEEAATMCQDVSSRKRIDGVELLFQLGSYGKVTPAAVREKLRQMAEIETDTEVLREIRRRELSLMPR